MSANAGWLISTALQRLGIDCCFFFLLLPFQLDILSAETQGLDLGLQFGLHLFTLGLLQTVFYTWCNCQWVP